MALTRLVSDYKDSVRVASTGANINLGAAPNTLDGVSLALNDRVLVKDQTPTYLNGIYRVITLGTGANGSWTRSSDFNDWREISPGSMVFVEAGSINGNAFYFINGGGSNVTIDSTAINFSNLYSVNGNITSFPGNVNVGGTLTVTGNIVTKSYETVTLTEYANSLTITGNIDITNSGNINIGAGGNIYMGSTALPRFRTGNTAPTSPNLGDTWYQGNTDILYEYIQDANNNKYWFDISSNPSSYGNLTVANTLTLNGTTNNFGTANLGYQTSVKILGGTPGYVLSTTDGLGTLTWVAVSATAGGANTMVQFSDAGALGGATYIQYNKTSGNLVSNSTTTSTSTTTGALVLSGGAGIGGSLYAGNIVTTSGIYYPNGSPAGGLPGGANTMVQFNSGGTFSGATFLQYNVTSGNLVSNSTTAATSTTTGALVLSGGAAIGGALYANNFNGTAVYAGTIGNTGSSIVGTLSSTTQTSITAVGTLTGLTTTGTIAGPTINGGVIGNTSTVVYGATISATTAFLPTANNAVSLANATNYMSSIYGVNYFVANALAPIANAVTSFGTSSAMPLNDYAVNYNVANVILPIANTTASIGTAQRTFQNIYGVSFFGTSTTAKYADLAEMYHADNYYAPGTVMVFGGDLDVTISKTSHDTRIAGVVSTNPAYLMNDNFDQDNWVPVALTGRVPCNVQGPVQKGDLLVSSDKPGIAVKLDKSKYEVGCIIGKSLEIINDTNIRKIEIAVGRY